ncbi:MAG: lipid-A-disaccharide synthase [Ignavibacteria bacterium]|jgi:lipid-A-disaccharide synthase|nr:lipid-A-disaccharide synthase [Ignavibacteria bacterium]MDH7527822.1 lipid-A-disaccharide synthase [Ignavibacteria bacterium]
MKNILIIAGETSGDLHGSNLVKSIIQLNPSIKFLGIGGDRMQEAGVELVYHINSLSFMGFIEVIKHIPYLKRVKKHILKLVNEKNPDAVILIDYPGFNLSIAKELHKLGKKIFYYISPQVWAWGKNRIDLIRKVVHKIIVVFPFEVKMYRDADVNVSFVGHPLLDVIENYQFDSKEEFFEQNSLDPSKKLLTIFPGSRKQELKKILPVVSDAAYRLKKDLDLNVAVAGLTTIPPEVYKEYFGSEFNLIFDKNYELMKYADAGIIKSGTSTLEAALFELPFVVVYKTSFLSYLIGKNLIQIDKISLANIVAGEKIVTELIQKDCNPQKIYSEIKELLVSEEKSTHIKMKLKRIKNLLGDKGASQRAAQIILSEI